MEYRKSSARLRHHGQARDAIPAFKKLPRRVGGDRSDARLHRAGGWERRRRPPGYRTAAPLRPALAHGGAWRHVRQQQLQPGVYRIGSGNLEACGGADRPAMKRRPRLPEAVPAWATWRCLAVVLIATGASMVFGRANAGDFYLRAGLGLDHPAETTFTDRDCSSTSPAALYGCDGGGDGAPYRSLGDFGTADAVEVGLGYAAAALRLEALVEYRSRFAVCRCLWWLVRSSSRIRSMIPVNGPRFGRRGGLPR